MAASDRDGHPAPEVVRTLLECRAEWLRFLERRLGSRAVAEDVLQDALGRSLEKLTSLRDEEAARAWFYRVLRNAVIDHQRRHATASRTLAAFADELAGAAEVPDDAPATVCRCVGEVAAKLKPEYAEALRRVDVEGVPVKDFAGEAGITSGNAAVRVFRARQALRKQVERTCGSCADDGCQDCTCGSKEGGGGCCGEGEETP